MSRGITFFSRFEPDILAGRKTITLRDASESHFQPGDVLRVSRHEDGVFFCLIEVLSVTPIRLEALTEQHAKQENMPLGELKQVIKEIYPGLDELFVIAFIKR
ncbi:N(4)-acetylcytidine aminohydrolase [Serratia odorifera]|jgi:N4-acetylcytidine amidohydrolase|uniref:N(4)-acetylcytidine amidohydrolase n=2 Tax=Serratia odorifera TaxID=618 RepID=D4E589_SEROD|nr:N(4)-acetylcytidine aminohydrolase [Serratia odorifera]EFE94905.1 ASCH domain protein [Serratia odorifera DSM 4582]MBJ2064373.1 ASCH domain-containing protein [Serratia odorifera]PNK89787.1 ASCH domain-containing protein [Serratia odorifera]RII70629.1 ASCH domain-containing protein [Serratia odorifera]VDZ62075.1 ASCH domain [Serratia odorifera]